MWSVVGGGALPALDIKAKGIAIDCGIDTEAIDCHEPCFNWDLDFITRGGRGGAVIRGSDVNINLEVRDASGGLRIRTFGTLTEQKNIHFNLKVVNSRGEPLRIQGQDSPIKNITFGIVDLQNTRLDAVGILGEVDGVYGDTLKIDGTWLRDGESSSGGRGLFVNGQAYLAGQRVKNIVIDKLKLRNVLKSGVELNWFEGITINHIDVDDSLGTDGFRANDGSNLSIPKGKIKHYANIYPLRTDRVDVVAVSCQLLADPTLAGSVGWRGVDTNNASLTSSPLITSQSNGALFSGTSDNILIVGNNATGVVAFTKFNIGTAANTVVANNLS